MASHSCVTSAAESAPAAFRRAPIAVALAAPLVVLCFGEFGLTPRAFVAAFFVAVLVLLSTIDIAERRVPNVIVLPAFLVTLAAQLVFYPDRAPEWVIAAVGAALVLVLPLLIYPGALGMGDVKLALLIGAALGQSVAPAFVVASLAAALFSAGVLVVHGSSARKRPIPYAPFLALGAIVALFLDGRLS